MALKVKEFMDIINNYAPTELKLDFDNVGLMVGNTDSQITSILIALDCTDKVIDEAIEKGCNMILTHHPLLFIKPKNITNETLLGKKIIKLIKNDISLYSAHTNLDAVKDGVNDFACRLLGFDSYEIIDKIGESNSESNSGIGRLIKLDEGITLNELCDRVKKAYEVDSLRYCGDEGKTINSIAIINGSGQDYFGLCRKLNVDCIITGDTTYHYVSDMSEEEFCIIDAGHFNSEWPAIKEIAKELQGILNSMNADVDIKISTETHSPYKTM